MKWLMTLQIRVITCTYSRLGLLLTIKGQNAWLTCLCTVHSRFTFDNKWWLIYFICSCSDIEPIIGLILTWNQISNKGETLKTQLLLLLFLLPTPPPPPPILVFYLFIFLSVGLNLTWDLMKRLQIHTLERSHKLETKLSRW